MKIVGFFVLAFVASMAAIMTLERYPKLRLIYGRRFKQFKEDIDKASDSTIGPERREWFAFLVRGRRQLDARGARHRRGLPRRHDMTADKRDVCGCHRECTVTPHDCDHPCVWPKCLTAAEEAELIADLKADKTL